jgi:hypothetical protein
MAFAWKDGGEPRKTYRDIPCRGLNLNQAPPQYESRAPPTKGVVYILRQ